MPRSKPLYNRMIAKIEPEWKFLGSVNSADLYHVGDATLLIQHGSRVQDFCEWADVDFKTLGIDDLDKLYMWAQLTGPDYRNGEYVGP